jgi:hypothetical protein
MDMKPVEVVTATGDADVGDAIATMILITIRGTSLACSQLEKSDRDARQETLQVIVQFSAFYYHCNAGLSLQRLPG